MLFGGGRHVQLPAMTLPGGAFLAMLAGSRETRQRRLTDGGVPWCGVRTD
ncbi:hypothetical protein ThrDRAFT_00035 [Frankia casuarinae]|nr:hypothetical protein CcI6DRAFT_01776 [Frankia sp. CcI6]EYT94111.1 hypothetical protein ThrDRAFT_00035 [Frankia casuarinae]KDA44301.1 hypothetical protein BMG523Draft_00800 [Frankia sp. BMG5.23]KEZ35892.1 hypothetical protein CEDDRAFT_02747 [Frankia sp. CeD]KFB06748.1 hypothetical protein ALLO2DRAFT_00034 [Frankia sp. Allo2]